ESPSTSYTSTRSAAPGLPYLLACRISRCGEFEREPCRAGRRRRRIESLESSLFKVAPRHLQPTDCRIVQHFELRGLVVGRLEDSLAAPIVERLGAADAERRGDIGFLAAWAYQGLERQLDRLGERAPLDAGAAPPAKQVRRRLVVIAWSFQGGSITSCLELTLDDCVGHSRGRQPLRERVQVLDRDAGGVEQLRRLGHQDIERPLSQAVGAAIAGIDPVLSAFASDRVHNIDREELHQFRAQAGEPYLVLNILIGLRAFRSLESISQVVEVLYEMVAERLGDGELDRPQQQLDCVFPWIGVLREMSAHGALHHFDRRRPFGNEMKESKRLSHISQPLCSFGLWTTGAGITAAA